MRLLSRYRRVQQRGFGSRQMAVRNFADAAGTTAWDSPSPRWYMSVSSPRWRFHREDRRRFDAEDAVWRWHHSLKRIVASQAVAIDKRLRSSPCHPRGGSHQDLALSRGRRSWLCQRALAQSSPTSARRGDEPQLPITTSGFRCWKGRYSAVVGRSIAADYDGDVEATDTVHCPGRSAPLHGGRPGQPGVTPTASVVQSSSPAAAAAFRLSATTPRRS